MFTDLMCLGWPFGPSGSPSAFKTYFGWVLAGTVHARHYPQQISTCCITMLSGDDLLRSFWEMEHCNLQQPVLSLNEQTVVDPFWGHLVEIGQEDLLSRCL